MPTYATNDQAAAPQFSSRSLRLRKVQQILDSSRSTVLREIERGRLKAFKVGNCWRVSADALAAYMEVE